ncbi:DUF664 domain-containing protein [Dermatophilaceae bacterium Soc4.6]
MTTAPWEPPLAGTEPQALLGALERLRSTFRYKVDDLDADGLGFRAGVSSLTLGGLLKHLALVETMHTTSRLDGSPIGEPWASAPWDDDPDWDLTSAAGDTGPVLYALYDEAVAAARSRIDTALAAGGLDAPVEAHDEAGHHANLRRLLLDTVEEYGRHTGHADLLREAVDGRVGEDPPQEWRPVSGHWTFA